jgi:hypothetical protein
MTVPGRGAMTSLRRDMQCESKKILDLESLTVRDISTVSSFPDRLQFPFRDI